MDIHNSIMVIQNSIMDIQKSIMDIHNSICILFKKDDSSFNMRLSLPIMQLRIFMINYEYS